MKGFAFRDTKKILFSIFHARGSEIGQLTMLSCVPSLNDECFFSIGDFGVGVPSDDCGDIRLRPGECTILDRVAAKEMPHRKFFSCTKQNRE